MPELIPFLITAALYVFVAIDFWRGARQGNPNRNPGLHRLLVALALIIHSALLYTSFFGAGLNLSLDNVLSAIFWLTVLIYWLNNLKYELHSLQALVLLPAALFVLLQYGMSASHVMPYQDKPLFVSHLLGALVAYGLFTFASLHALLMMVAERRLHNKSSIIKLPAFPPLMVMETLLFRVIGVGFLLLTLTLLSGILFSEQIFGQALKFNHKNVFAILAWIVYGGLLLGRFVYGWRGKTAIRWTLSGFVILVLAYIGTKFVLEILLHR